MGNYSRYLIGMMYRQHPSGAYLLYAPEYRQSRQLDSLLAGCPGLEFRYPQGLWKRFRSLWRTFGITRRLDRDRVDIYHGLSNELPLNIRKARRTKSVVTVHDLIFIRYPRYYAPIDRWLYRYKYGKSCRNADAVVAISECTKNDIIRYFHTDPSKIRTIYQGCDPSFSAEASEAEKDEARKAYGLPPRYILNVGSIEERKNVMLAVKAMKGLPGDVHLVIVGKPTPYTRKVEQFIAGNGLSARVHLLHNVAFSHLPAIYQMAEIFVYPSRYEGFGIPILEALSSGIPVVAATGSCLEEAGGKSSLYVGPDDEEGMKSALLRLLGDAGLRKRMAEEGRRHALNFSMERQAKQLMDLYEQLLSDKK